MAIIRADGNKLIECGEDITKLCKDYQIIINELFSKLTKINQIAWTGDSANEYIQKISKDKDTFVSFGKDLANYGVVLRSTGNNINTMVEKWKNK